MTKTQTLEAMWARQMAASQKNTTKNNCSQDTTIKNNCLPDTTTKNNCSPDTTKKKSQQSLLLDVWNQLETKQEHDLYKSRNTFQNLTKVYKERKEAKKKQSGVKKRSMVPNERNANVLKRKKTQKKIKKQKSQKLFANQVIARLTQLTSPKTKKKAKKKKKNEVSDLLPILTENDRLSLDFVTQMMDEFKNGRILQSKNIFMILQRVKPLFSRLENIVYITLNDQAKLTVVGDIHGQLADLLTIFQLNGLPSETNLYLFNGDFVDRGSNSTEVILILFAFKLMYPSAVHLNRGNHESPDINGRDGFQDELLKKYRSHNIFYAFSHIFQHLPLATIVENKIFVVHGGLFSEDGVTIDDIMRINRAAELVPPEESLMEQMLWSDPVQKKGRRVNQRGAGVEFGPDVAKKWMELNGLEMIVRSHECVEKGFRYQFNKTLLTVFSASNYCGVVENLGAFAIFQKPSQINKPRCVSYSALKNSDVHGVHMRQSLETDVTNKLIHLLCVNRLGCIDYFRKKSPNGLITRKEWAQGLKKVLGLNIPFLDFQHFLGLPELGWDGKKRGLINYYTFFLRFRPVYSPVATPESLCESSDDNDSDFDNSNNVVQDFSEENSSKEGGTKITPQLPKRKKTPEERLLRELSALLTIYRYDLESLFRFFDLDGSGTISLGELKDGLMSLGLVLKKSFNDTLVDRVLKLMDQNNDGIIQYDEFFEKFKASGWTNTKPTYGMKRRPSDPCLSISPKKLLTNMKRRPSLPCLSPISKKIQFTKHLSAIEESPKKKLRKMPSSPF